MKLKILQKYYAPDYEYQGIHIFMFETQLFKIKWFTDCGEWFIYIMIKNNYWRFSGAGYLKGKIK